MDVEKIKKEVLEIVADIAGVEVDVVKENANLANDLGVDSIKGIEMAVEIEKKYKIRLRDEDIAQILSVQHVMDLTEKVIRETGADV